MRSLLLEKDLKYIWHPYTQMKDTEVNPPILIEKAEGIKLFDESGNFFYDTISSWWCNIHGHNHPHIKNAIIAQLDKLDHVLFAGFTHLPAINLAEKIINLMPKYLTKVFYSDNGSTSVEVALKMSFQYWYNRGQKNKTKFLCLDKAYHGDTIGTMSVSGSSVFNDIFSPLLAKNFQVTSPDCYRCPHKKNKNSCQIDCIQNLETLLKEKSEEIAALILEPLVLGSGGMIIYPTQYLEKAAQLAKKYKIHLILDEVATGFGRTGKMFAFEHTKIEPDFVCLSKGITSGTLPLAMTITTEDVFGAFYDDYSKKKTFYHGHTYTANPIACSAGIASLEIFEMENSLEKIKPVAKLLEDGLKKMLDFDFVGDVRCIGLIGALELVKDKKTKKGFDFDERIGYKIYQKALQKNLILRPLGNILYLYLPLVTTEKDLSIILEKTYDCLKDF